jgi:hypothetical protein
MSLGMAASSSFCEREREGHFILAREKENNYVRRSPGFARSSSDKGQREGDDVRMFRSGGLIQGPRDLLSELISA